MNEEERKAVEYWKDYMSILHWNTQLTSEHYMKILLDLIEKQQNRITELEKINAEHQELNCELRSKLNEAKDIITKFLEN